MDTLKQKSLEKYTSQFEAKELQGLYESIGHFLDISVEKVTPEMVLNMPEINEKEVLSTNKASVLARCRALMAFGIYNQEKDILDFEFVLENSDQGDDPRHVQSAFVSNEWRSRVISTYAVYTLLPEVLGLTQGLGVKKQLDENGHQIKSPFQIKDWDKEVINNPKTLPAYAEYLFNRLMEHRVDTVGYSQKIPGLPYSMETHSRRCGNPVNADGKVSIEELTNIIKIVTQAIENRK